MPQGSILGPILFNIFINDIFSVIEKSNLYNYADDNTLSYSSKDIEELKSTLTDESQNLINWFDENCMEANPDKFQILAVGAKTHKAKPNLVISNFTLEPEDSVKLLGIDIDFALSFDCHVKNIVNKAAKQVNVLRRLSKLLNSKSKLIIFHSFIISNFNFCPLAWHFCTAANTEKIEKIQKRALKFVYPNSDLSYEALLAKTDLPLLTTRRLRLMAIEAFKILNNYSPICLRDLVTFRDSKINFRYQDMTYIPRVNTEKFGKKSFRYASSVLWNSLPAHLRAVKDLNQFKLLIRKWSFDKDCKCNLCSSHQ